TIASNRRGSASNFMSYSSRGGIASEDQDERELAVRDAAALAVVDERRAGRGDHGGAAVLRAARVRGVRRGAVRRDRGVCRLEAAPRAERGGHRQGAGAPAREAGGGVCARGGGGRAA